MTAAQRYLRLLWAAVAVQLAGTAIDQYWHATHDEFEKATDQIQAHTVLWIGVLGATIVSGIAFRAARGRVRYSYLVVLLAGIVYGIVSVWHFIEHANGADPTVAHVFLFITWAAVLAGAALTTVNMRRQLALPPTQGGAAPDQ